jgi:hypothetical protein
MYDINIIPGKPDPAERVSSLPIIGPPYKKVSLYKTQVLDLKVGEKFLIHTDGQVTTKYTYNVMLSTDIVLMSNDGNTIVELAEGQGQNFNKEEHHFNWPRIASLDVTVPRPGTWWICHRAWAASTAAGSGNTLVVDKDSGSIVIWRYSPVSIPDLKARLGIA